MSKKKGRPTKENGRRDNKLDVRFTDDEIEMIKELAFDIDTSRNDIIRRAVKMYYFSRMK